MIHYPLALPFEPAYSRFNFMRNDFPVAFRLQHEVLSLPCHPEMTAAMVDYVCDIVHDYFESD